MGIICGDCMAIHYLPSVLECIEAAHVHEKAKSFSLWAELPICTAE